MTPSPEPDNRYPAPAIYDILNTPGTRDEIDAFERILRALGGTDDRNRLWFEPACGTGRYLRLVCRRGHRAAGFDTDAAMLTYARRRRELAGATLFRADMASFLQQAHDAGVAAGSVDVAINPVNSLRHLPSDRSLVAHLDQMAVLLEPRGLYIVGISLTDYRWLEPEEDLWEGARGRCRVRQLVNYLPPEPGTPRARVETVISHLSVIRPRGTDHLDQRYDLRTYDRRQWEAVIGRSKLVRIASRDPAGRPLAGRRLPYQLEVLGRRSGQ